MDERLEAGLASLNASATPPEAPPVEPEVTEAPTPPAPTPVQPAATPAPDREAAERAVQARFQATQAARATEERKALEAERASLAAERAAIQRAKDSEALLKNDPLAFFRAHGLDPKEVLARVEQADRISPVVAARLDPLAKQNEALAAKVAELEQKQQAYQAQQAQRSYESAMHELTSTARQQGFELLQDHIENGLDEAYLNQVATEVYAKNPHARPADVASAMNEGLKAEAKRFIERHRSLLGEFTPPVATPATATKASAAPPKVTITQAVASQASSGLPKELTADERLERAVAIFSGKPG